MRVGLFDVGNMIVTVFLAEIVYVSRTTGRGILENILLVTLKKEFFFFLENLNLEK